MSHLTQAVSDGTKFLQSKPTVINFDLIGSCLFMEEARDVDFLVLIRSNAEAPSIFGTHCTRCADDNYEAADSSEFTAWRYGLINYIATPDIRFYNGMLRASCVAAALELRKKSDRVMIHRIIRDGWSIAAAKQEAVKWEGQ